VWLLVQRSSAMCRWASEFDVREIPGGHVWADIDLAAQRYVHPCNQETRRGRSPETPIIPPRPVVSGHITASVDTIEIVSVPLADSPSVI
jgi:hypothetical protein